MLAELMFLEATLSRWLKTPDAPICEISLAASDKRDRPYSSEEIQAMRGTMKRCSWQCYIRLFYNEGPFVHPPGSWPHPFRARGLCCYRTKRKHWRNGRGDATPKG